MLSIDKNKTSTKKSASVYIGGCRITSSTTAASGNIYSYQYFLTDHLGSTRMVLDEDEQIVEATMYQPYGTMLPVEGIGTTSAMPVREKFTTKEFDEDGAARGQLEIDFTFDPSVNLTHTSGDPLETNRIGIYFEDEPYEPVFAIYDQASEKWEIKGKFSYTTNRVIDRIHFMLNDDAINCMVYDIAVEVNQGTIVQISKHDITLSDLTPALPKTFFTYKTVGGFYMAGIGGYHFGARMFDPEVGVFTSTDPAGQFWNSYSYTGGNPVNLVDPNGENAAIALAIFGAVAGAYLGGAAANGTFDPTMWQYDEPGTWTGMIGGAGTGASIGYGVGKGIDAKIARANYYRPQLRAPEGGLLSIGGEGQPVQVASNGGIYSPSGVANGRILQGISNIYQNEAIFLSAAADVGIPDNWLKATYLSEFTTAKHGLTGTGLVESAMSGLPFNKYGLKNPSAGTYGPFNLGYDARALAKKNLGITFDQVLTMKGGAPAAANWLAFERGRLIDDGISNPTAGMVFTRYNYGPATPGSISGYGGRTVYLMNTYFP